MIHLLDWGGIGWGGGMGVGKWYIPVLPPQVRHARDEENYSFRPRKQNFKLLVQVHTCFFTVLHAFDIYHWQILISQLEEGGVSCIGISLVLQPLELIFSTATIKFKKVGKQKSIFCHWL